MKIRTMGVLLLAAAFAMSMTGCEGDTGPQGPPGPPGDTLEFSFAGKSGEPCMHCHAGVVENWKLTGHPTAVADLPSDSMDDPYCLQCHTTGWDSPVEAGGQLDPANRGPNDEGYDDYFGVDTELAAERRADLEGVQCEACHGPMGPDFNSHRPDVSFATRFAGTGDDRESLSLCDPCHNNQLEEWAVSGHATYDEATGTRMSIEDFNSEHFVGRSSCDVCHTSEGFLRANDPVYASYDFPDQESFIGCVTCHDPHEGDAGGGNVAQLRNVGPVEVEYHPGYQDGDVELPRLEGKGAGQACAQCHHARRDTDHVQDQIANGYAHFGPHSSPQMDMFLGAGSYEISGFNYDGEHGHETLPQACVTCHMVTSTDPSQHKVHDFNPTVEQSCGGAVCHDGATDFDINGRLTTIANKMDTLAQGLGFADAADFSDNFDSLDPAVEVWEREAAYALVFVMSDGSGGAHHPDYAESLLDNAIQHVNDNTIFKRGLGR